MNYRKLWLRLCMAAMPVAMLVSCSAQKEKAADSDGYTLIWHDEFDGSDESYPSPEAYEVPLRSPGVAWARFISDRKDLMVVSGGVLHMYCRPNPAESRDERNPGEMVSGAIQTKGHFSFNCGRIEARIRVEGYPGSFPAFWLMPNNQPHGWPTGGEIDIFESINNEDMAYATLHAGLEANQDLNTPGYHEKVNIDDWHVYGLDWTPDSMSFTLDGEVCGSVGRSTVREGVWPFGNSNFYIILNQSVGKEGGWAAPPDTTHTYLTEVDWVRVYQRPGQTSQGASTSPTKVD